MRWRKPWPADGWMKLKRRGAPGEIIALPSLAAGSPTNSFLRRWSRPACETSFARVHFFWADERCLPPGDPENNFKMANELLFMPLGIPETHVHRLRGEDLPDRAVKFAEAELRQFASINDGWPVLDLIFLGMGEDGHVASLFQNAIGEDEKGAKCTDSFVFVDDSPKPPPRRISLTFNAIAVARVVWVLASGSGKETALKESLSGSGRTPLGQVIRLRAQTKIFSDIQGVME